MKTVRCIQCGNVNLTAGEVCIVCGAELCPEFFEQDSAGPDPSPRVYTDDIPPFTGPSDGIGPTFHLFKKNLWLISKIVFVIVAPFEIFKTLSLGQAEIDWQLFFGLFALERVCDVLITPALFYALLKVMQTGIAPGINEAYRWGLSKIPKLALAEFLSWILTLIGLALFIVPGIILNLAFVVVAPVILFEQGSATDALRRSWQLTKGHKVNILGASIVLGLLTSVINAVAVGAVGIFTLNGLHFWPLNVAAAIVTDIFARALTVLSLVVYVGILRTLESGQSVIE